MAKIAVIGSGVAGMTAAHLLSRKNETHLFESAARPGGHTATMDIETPSGRYAIDTGFIVFNDWTYPHFIRLMKSIGIESRDSEMSFSVRNEATGLEYNGKDFAHLFAQRRNLVRPSFYRMLLEIVRFNREAPALLELPEGHPDAGITIGTYLDRGGYSSMFRENYVLAMGAAIWSASFAQMRDFPARFFVSFFKNHGMLSVNDRPVWKTIRGGSRSYIGPLLAPLGERVHLNSPVNGVRREDHQAVLWIGGKDPRIEKFDQVVFACHSDTAREMLLDPSDAEREVLGDLDYQPNDVILHTDSSILPRTRKTWAAWNYFLPQAGAERVSVTYHMNILQGIVSPEDFLVSLNLDGQIDPAKILGRYVYDHPKFTLRTVAAQKRWAEISRLDRRTHFCGAYWSYGFHEDGVRSGVRVAEAFGEKLA